jgi:hypothetical protein
MTKLGCPNCKNRRNLTILECNACGFTTVRCPECKSVYRIEEGKLVLAKIAAPKAWKTRGRKLGIRVGESSKLTRHPNEGKSLA